MPTSTLSQWNIPVYNDYPMFNSETVQFDCEPVMDEANRTVLYMRYTIGIRFYANATHNPYYYDPPAYTVPSTSLNDAMENLRYVLMQRGKPFDFGYRGMGTEFNVNNPDYATSLYDVQGGPVPKHFSFKPVGQHKGAAGALPERPDIGAWCHWIVELCLPMVCAPGDTTVDLSRPYTFNFRLRHKVNKHGYSTRTYSGHIMVPKSITNTTTIADAFVDQIIPDVPPGFERVDSDIEHSYDKKRCDFVVVDQELTNQALPEGCTEAHASHTITNGGSLIDWNGTITGNYSVAKGYKPDVAWSAFRDVVKHRLDIATSNLTLDFPGAPVPGELKPNEKPIIIITGYSLGEPEIYGTNNASFTVQYRQCSSLKALIGVGEMKGGLYRYPIEGTAAWERWKASMYNVHRPGGLAQLHVDPNDEVVVDFCTTVLRKPSREAIMTEDTTGTIIGDILSLQPDPDIDRSWLLYEPEITIVEDNHAVVSSALTEEVWSPYEAAARGYDQGYVPDNKPSDETDTVQYRCPSTLYVQLSGRAQRAWFPIHAPKILEYGGFAVKDVSTKDHGNFWRQKNVGSLGISMPIYYAEWNFTYAVTARPTSPIRPPQSLAEQT